jgi:hypothetical protein
VQATAERLPFADASFDVALSASPSSPSWRSGIFKSPQVGSARLQLRAAQVAYAAACPVQ